MHAATVEIDYDSYSGDVLVYRDENGTELDREMLGDQFSQMSPAEKKDFAEQKRQAYNN